MSAPLPRFVEDLLSPSAYGHPAEDVELIQTHASYVLLAGDFAYKVKKPLNLGFLDYSTLERRKLMCEEEVRLNRRLCPETYLGVARIVSDGARARFDEGRGDVIEYAVKMRRMPADRMMPMLLARGEVTADDVHAIARTIARFHASTATDEYIARFGEVEAIRENWNENFEQTAPFVGHTVTRTQFDGVRGYVERFLAANAALIEERAGAGRTRDCHGDLRADAIVIGADGSICVMDCIEFNDRIRFGDVAGDIGFLAMDLDLRGRGGLADELMAAYLAETRDETLPLVLDFYRCYRAYIRGKVESLQAAEPEIPEEQRQRAIVRASASFALAEQYALTSYPRTLVTLVGLSGSGKSHFGYALACRLGAVVLSSDVVRRRLVGVVATAAARTAYGAGIYGEAARERVYDEMHRLAGEQLARGRRVVLDATYMRHDDRAAALAVAAAAGAPSLTVEVVADESTVRQRLERRRDETGGVSDALWEIYVEQRKRFEPPVEIPAEEFVRIDSADPIERNIDRVLQAVTRRG